MTLYCGRCDCEGQGTIDDLPPGWMAQAITMSAKPIPLCADCAGTAPESSRSSSSNGNGDDHLRLFIERIERMKEEEKGIKDDIRETYSEAKAVGYDTKIMREVIKLRSMTKNDRDERDAILDTYRVALGLT